jgi:GNAT superfamily N-acetyltransferase
MTTAETPPYIIEPLSTAHNRAGFTCGVEALDRYFATQVTQDIRRRIATCFIAVECASGTVAGFYAMATGSIPLSDLAPAIAKKLPRYPLIPAVKVGRLAVAKEHRGKKLGSVLVADAIDRALRLEIATFAIVVDAKDDTAAAFYKRHSLMPFASSPMSLYLPLADATRAEAMKQTRKK